MKKKSVKKMALNKESLHLLEKNQLPRVAGGRSAAGGPCISDLTQCTLCTCHTCFC